MHWRDSIPEVERDQVESEPCSRPILKRPCLMLVTEPMDPLHLVYTVRAAVMGGVDIVQFRNKATIPWGVNYLDYLVEVVDLLEGELPETVMVINSSSPETSGIETFSKRISACVGRHLPEQFGSIAAVRESIGAQALVGRSVHSIEGAIKAQSEGADYVVAGTVYASASHPDTQPQGLQFLEQVCSAVTLPVIAIGGIKPESVEGCLLAGAAGVAVLSPIMRAADPYLAARGYRLALDAGAPEFAGRESAGSWSCGAESTGAESPGLEPSSLESDGKYSREELRHD